MVTGGNCGCRINGRTKPRYRDRVLELDLAVYLTKMPMSHLVMKTFINVCLSFLLLMQTCLRKNINEKKNFLNPRHFFLFFLFLVNFKSRCSDEVNDKIYSKTCL